MKTTLATVCFLCVLATAPLAKAEKEPPVPVRVVAPDYPFELHRAGISGVVTIKCTIDEHGDVTGTEVLKTTDSAFEKPAVDAVLKWKFKPAKLDGKAVSTKAIIPVKFVAGD